jgi:hypothetical protein
MVAAYRERIASSSGVVDENFPTNSQINTCISNNLPGQFEYQQVDSLPVCATTAHSLALRFAVVQTGPGSSTAAVSRITILVVALKSKFEEIEYF